MATILIKRGTTVPTTSKLSRYGELAADYQTGRLYLRCTKGVMCVNTDTIVSTSSAGGRTSS